MQEWTSEEIAITGSVRISWSVIFAFFLFVLFLLLRGLCQIQTHLHYVHLVTALKWHGCIEETRHNLKDIKNNIVEKQEAVGENSKLNSSIWKKKKKCPERRAEKTRLSLTPLAQKPFQLVQGFFFLNDSLRWIIIKKSHSSKSQHVDTSSDPLLGHTCTVFAAGYSVFINSSLLQKTLKSRRLSMQTHTKMPMHSSRSDSPACASVKRVVVVFGGDRSAL